MVAEQPQVLNVRRGLSAAMVGGFAAAGVVLAIPFVLRTTALEIPGATESRLGYDLGKNPEMLAGPVIGCAALCACAGWATFAPVGRYRFSWSLAIVFLVSVGLWLVATVLDFAPRHYKSLTDWEWYPRLAAFLIIPPVCATIVLTVVRIRHARQKQGP